MASAYKSWNQYFETARHIAPDKDSEEYLRGQAEAERAVTKARAQMEAYRPKAGNKNFSPINGEIEYHLHAFRHGFNQHLAKEVFRAKKSVAASSTPVLVEGLFADVYSDPVSKYPTKKLVRNEVMISEGRQFAGVMLALSGKGRADVLNGFRDKLESYNIDMFPPVLPAEEPSTPVEDEESSSSSSSSVPVVDTLPGEPFTFNPDAESHMDSATGRTTNWRFQQRVVRQYKRYVKEKGVNAPQTHFEVVKYDARALLTSTTEKRIEALVMDVIKVETYKVYSQLNGGEFAFVAGYGAGENYRIMQRDMIEKVERAKAYARQDAGEGAAANVIDESEDIRTALDVLNSDDAHGIFKLAFSGAINKYFSTWDKEGSVITDGELLDAVVTGVRTNDHNSALLEKLAPADIIQKLFKAWQRVRRMGQRADVDSSAEEGSLYFAFSYFADVGILAGIEFLRAFVKQATVYEGFKERTRYPLWYQAFTWYTLGCLTCIEIPNKKVPVTTHILSMDSKLKFISAVSSMVPDAPPRSRFTVSEMAAIIPNRKILRATLDERETGYLVSVLDPQQAYFNVASSTNGTASDIIFGLINEGFVVDAETAKPVVNVSDNVTMTWEMRVLQSWLVSSYTSRVLRPWQDNSKRTDSFRRQLVGAANNELKFYEMIGMFAENFNHSELRRLVRTYEKRLPAGVRREEGPSDYVQYASIIEHQLGAWLERCRKFFDEEQFMSEAWQFISKLWDLDEMHVEAGSTLYKVIEKVFARAIIGEKLLFLQRRAVIAQLEFPVDLPFSDQSDLMLSELFASIYRLQSAFTPEIVELVSTVRSVAMSGDSADEASTKMATDALSALFNKLWEGKRQGEWLSDADQDALLERVRKTNVSMDEFDFFGAQHGRIGLSAVAEAGSLFTLAADRDTFVQLLTSAYLVEMYINCNVIVADIIDRKWGELVTYNDIYSLKDSLVVLDMKASKYVVDPIYRALVNSLLKADIAGGIDMSGLEATEPTVDDSESLNSEDDEEEEEEGEEEEEEEAQPVYTEEYSGYGQTANFADLRRDFMSGIETTQAKDDYDEVPDLSPPEAELTGPVERIVWNPPVVSRRRPVIELDDEPEPPKQARAASSEPVEPEQLFDVSAIENMHGPLRVLVVDSARITRRSVLFDKQDYATYQAGEVAGSTFARDLSVFVTENFTPSQHSAKFADVRAYALNQLANIYADMVNGVNIGDELWDRDSSNPVAQRHDVEVVRKLLSITNPVAARIYGYEGKKVVYMSGFVRHYENTVVETMAHFAEMDEERGGGRKSALVGDALSEFEDLSLDTSTDDYDAGRAAAEGVAQEIEDYAHEQNIPYYRALQRVQRDVTNNINTVEKITSQFAAEEIVLEYNGNRDSFARGLFEALAERQPPPVRVRFYSDAMDEEPANVDEIVEGLFATEHHDELEFYGSGFTAEHVVAVLGRVNGMIKVTMLRLTCTNVDNLAQVIDAAPSLTQLAFVGTTLSTNDLQAALTTNTALDQLETLILDYPILPNDEEFTNGIGVIGDYLAAAKRLRDVEIYLSPLKNEDINEVVSAMMANGVRASQALAAFFCTDVYPSNDFGFHKDEIAQALAGRRSALVGKSIRGHKRHGTLSAAKAKEILADGTVRGHPLTPKAHRFMEMIAHGGHPTRMAK